MRYSVRFSIVKLEVPPAGPLKSVREQHSNCTYKRMGSNPISPGKDPSSFSGRTKKGMDLDISSAYKETEVRWA